MLLCRILHRALFVISSTYGNSSTAWHLERLDLALNQAQTNTHLGQCSLLLTIPTSPCCLEQEKQAGSTAGPFQLKALYFSILSYPSPLFYLIRFVLFYSIPFCSLCQWQAGEAGQEQPDFTLGFTEKHPKEQPWEKLPDEGTKGEGFLLLARQGAELSQTGPES